MRLSTRISRDYASSDIPRTLVLCRNTFDNMCGNYHNHVDEAIRQRCVEVMRRMTDTEELLGGPVTRNVSRES